MIPRSDYHSAHKPPVSAPVLNHWDGERCSAFVLDILDTAPSQVFEKYGYRDCDVLVTDLPWRKGFDEFNRRAGATDGRTYPAFMQRVGQIINAGAVPTYLVTGRHALHYLPAPDVVLPMRLNEDEAVAIGYRPGVEAFADYGIAQEFLHALADTYGHAGDFCCGYGRTGRFFLRAGKRALLSDINPRCVGYIAEHAAEWVV